MKTDGIPQLTEHDCKCAAACYQIAYHAIVDDGTDGELDEGNTIHAIALEIEANRTICRVERVGDAILRWIITLTFTLCGSAFLAAYAAQYLSGR